MDLRENWDNSFPVLLKEDCVFVKEDKHGSVILYSKKFKSAGQVTLNSMSWFIVGLCDGKHSVHEIYDRIHEKYDVPKEVDVLEDINRTLSSLYKLEMVKVEGKDFINDKFFGEYKGYHIENMKFDDIMSEIRDMGEKGDYIIDNYRKFEIDFAEKNLNTSYSTGYECFFRVLKDGRELGIVATLPDGRYGGYWISLMRLKEEIPSDVFDTWMKFIHFEYMKNEGIPKELVSDDRIFFYIHTLKKEENLGNMTIQGELKKEFQGKTVYLYGCYVNNDYNLAK